MVRRFHIEVQRFAVPGPCWIGPGDGLLAIHGYLGGKAGDIDETAHLGTGRSLCLLEEPGSASGLVDIIPTKLRAEPDSELIEALDSRRKNGVR